MDHWRVAGDACGQSVYRGLTQAERTGLRPSFPRFCYLNLSHGMTATPKCRRSLSARWATLHFSMRHDLPTVGVAPIS